ncbi:MAG: hypothetical protein K8L97_21685 [Anaerolineae bacterium]|nr:hypothetical protein [Anaerolineae bacterium]
MSIDLEHIRSRNPIEDVVNEKFTLKKQGSRFVSLEHDSLVVTPRTGFYFWNSKGEHGDVFDFVGRYILGYGTSWNNRDATQFMEVAKYLAQRAGITIEEDKEFRRSHNWAERQLVTRLHEALLKHKPALEYATQIRGWQLSTVRAARLGFMPVDKRSLVADLNLSDNWRKVIRDFPGDMMVYLHLDQGRLMYLSGRSITAKKHYNPPREVIGERQPYFNALYAADADQVVVVEGQADAVTFAEWGIAAVALGGMSLSDELLARLKPHRRLFIALDNVPETVEKTRTLCQSVGVSAHIPRLPGEVKDANEWLVKLNAAPEQAAALLNHATPWLEAEVQRVGNLMGLAREDGIRELFQYAVQLDEFGMANFKNQMAKIGVKARMFNDLFRAGQAVRQAGVSTTEEEVPEILSDDVPLLSPALGFHRDVAMLTITIIERTKANRLNTQPYLVTSTRELRRLTEQQIIQLNGQDVALRTLPDACEFLMRWRYRDVQRFLSGEAVEPGTVFNAVHDVFTRYVDFRSPVESRILTLWIIGTYFYTMFPAYPYLALNGPKNSGKSTVLRVAQPLGFNMVNTSDPTGPSMFRLIHTTSCTVGIDEAERYHNPRDPGMQQIRQLLNSGYKAGMPAIRLMGDDMKPQAFDVYSPKILAAIAGLEDILASRCIAIPMRRTDCKMQAFPADFDAAVIRHQLYTLALTHFTDIHRNYFERPDLHRLHNRSGELWSPLVALAAFFEEEGSVAGLLQAISEAAEWDEQVSEGKALSDREEAVLEALDVMTRTQSETVWLKAAAVREEVAKLLGQPSDKLGDAQWIGHILKRLHLLDDGRRKRTPEGMTYAVQPAEVRDMMRRYDVAPIDSGKR